MRTLLLNLAWTIVIGLGLGVLLGLPFDPFAPGNVWYVVLVTGLAALFQWWPYFRYRDPAA